jgi:hypothetical protein
VTTATLNYAGPLAGAVLAFALGWWLLGARRWFDGPNTADDDASRRAPPAEKVDGKTAAAV